MKTMLVAMFLFAFSAQASFPLPPGASVPPPPPGLEVAKWDDYFRTSFRAAETMLERLKGADAARIKKLGLSKFDLSKAPTLQELGCLALRLAQRLLENDGFEEVAGNMESNIQDKCGGGSGGLGAAYWDGMQREVAREYVKTQTKSIMLEPSFWRALLAGSQGMNLYSATVTAKSLRMLATDPKNASPEAKAAAATVGVALGGVLVIEAMAPEAAAAAVVPLLPIKPKK